jgi:putative endonuclease
MAKHNLLGTTGEHLAVKWLTEHGYTILHRNWRYSYLEIDIIAIKDGKLRIIEVKTRESSAYGHPEQAVTRKKFKRLQVAADQYLFLHPGFKWMFYDVLAITFIKGAMPEYFLLEDVFIK